MLATQFPKTSHKPLQPKNQLLSITKPKPKPKPRLDWWAHDNKENIPPQQKDSSMECIDGSLADELSAIRERLDRLRIDREKNERLLRERGLMLDLHLQDILNRGQAQKQLEIEVDRLYRLKEIRVACTRISQVRSLRDKEEEKQMNQDILNKAQTTSGEGIEEKIEGYSQISISELTS
ncbi:Unknown protein [Striga hermonthica]|uniref:Uncharacterized protein n=1 Tax=Striga hermonthica TaxID=68872 RepID=A0A9N7RPI9_STRHE|nr:Unknown protein [Striga hermonthica]